MNDMFLIWVKRGLGFLLRFFFRSFKAAMKCFFRTRDDHRHLPAPPQLVSAPPRSTEVLISGNRLSSLLSKEREDSARNDDVGSQEYDQGLKDEVKFLKACGTLAGTPAEIRKTSAKLKVSPACDSDSNPSKFHSWLPNTSVEKLGMDVQPFDLPTPIKLGQEWGNNTDSFDIEQTPSSYKFNAQDTHHDSPDYVEGSWTRSIHTANKTRKNEASVTPWPATDTQRKNKSVRFECEDDLVSYRSPSDDWHMKKSKSPNNQSASKRSPYPTPMKLFDEMQTPGTVYPAPLEELPDDKPRIRSQFVYPAHNPGGNVFPCKILEEKDFSPEQDSRELSDSGEPAQNATTPTPENDLKRIANENESKEEASLSSWLKPASIIVKERNKSMEASQIPHAADRQENEDPQVFSPKFWDINGIPNSTKKYKEDQKVKWHATPFEERLDKALYEENFISKRKIACGKPVAFEEIDEDDTQLSQQQSSTSPRSVVSC